MEEKRLIDSKELSRILNVPISWIYDHVKTLPHFKFGHYVRFDAAEVLRVCRQNDSEAGQ